MIPNNCRLQQPPAARQSWRKCPASRPAPALNIDLRQTALYSSAGLSRFIPKRLSAYTTIITFPDRAIRRDGNLGPTSHLAERCSSSIIYFAKAPSLASRPCSRLFGTSPCRIYSQTRNHSVHSPTQEAKIGNSRLSLFLRGRIRKATGVLHGRLSTLSDTAT